MKRIGVVVLLAMICAAGLCGCSVFSPKDRAVVEHRAVVMRALADKLNAAPADVPWDRLTLAYIIECEARAAQNLSDAARFRKPTYERAPQMPTALPWVPVDLVPAGEEEGGEGN